jgi:deoxyribonuclease-4
VTRLIGAHTVDAGGIHMAALRAGRGGMKSLQIFTAIPKYYGDKTSIRPERVTRFRAALAEAGIEPVNVMAHAAYVLNTASEDETKWERAAAGLRKELERSTALGIGSLCFHPGAATGGDHDSAVRRVAKAITGALEAVPGNTRVLVENTAGAGMTVGRTPDEIGGILGEIPAKLRRRTGYGLDTCHLFAAGLDLSESAAMLGAILDAFEAEAGGPPSFFHLNDSAGALGSNRDRHVLIGDGRIGSEPFRWLMQDPRSAGIPLILETPQQNYEPAEDDPSPDPYDVRMVGLLQSFVP